MTDIQIFPTEKQLIQSAAKLFISTGQQAIRDRSRYSVALAGGSTPLPLYEYLANPGLDQDLAWDRVHFFWGDERMVPGDHPDSNFGQTNHALLEPRSIPDENIHRIEGEILPAEAARKYQKLVQDHFSGSPPRFDLILLGMGADGHTASLFPGSHLVEDSPGEQAWIAPVLASHLDSWRISFTPALIRAAGKIVFLVTGSGKAHTLERVLKGPYQPSTLPAQLFRDQASWLIDQDAATQL